MELGEAVQQLLTHAGSEDEQDLLTKLNHKQKLILVARVFRKEATTTVLWLNEQGLDGSYLEPTPHFDPATNNQYMQRSYIILVAETEDLTLEKGKGNALTVADLYHQSRYRSATVRQSNNF